MTTRPQNALRDPARLDALRRIALLDDDCDRAFERLARLAVRVLRTPMAIVSLVDDERVIVKASVGIPAPWAGESELQLADSFSRHVVASGAPLAASDVADHPLLAHTKVAKFGVAFAAVPLATPDGLVVGTFAAVERERREWSADELGILGDLAEAAMTELELRLARFETRRRGEEAEHERRRRSDLLEHMTDAFVDLTHDGRIRSVNAGAERLLGTERAALVGRRVWDVLPSAVATPFSTHFHELGQHRSPASVEFEQYHEPLHAWLRVRAHGSSEGVSVFFQDVTEQRRAADELRDAEARYRALVEQVPLITYMDRLDELSSNIYTSPQSTAVLGYTPEDWREDERLFDTLLHPDDRERVLAAHERVRATGHPLREEYRLQARDGRYVWFHDEAVVVRDEDGTPMFLQGILLDISDRKAADAENAAGNGASTVRA